MWEFIKRHKESVTLIGLCFVSILTMWFSGRTSMSGPQELGTSIANAFQNLATNVGNGVGGMFDSITKFSSLQEDYNTLQAKYQELESNKADNAQIISENKTLREILDFSTSLKYKNLPAQVIAKAPGIYFPSITINKGYNNGIRTGMPVLTYQNGVQALIGKIESVTPQTSVMLPLFNESVYVSARLEESRFEGIVKGGGFSTDPLIMQFVDANAEQEVKVGEVVVTSGINSKYPPGIPIGKVTSIDSRPYENSLELELNPVISLSRVEHVFVLLINDEEVTP